MSKKILIAVIIILITAGALYWVFNPENVLKFVMGVNQNLEEVKKADVGSTLQKISGQVFTSDPLKVGGLPKGVTLLQSKIILETNLARSENGALPALKENLRLNEAALAKANDMFLNGYFEHVSPSGVDPGALVKSHGYEYITAGENLILGNFSSEKEVVDAWMNSPGHRANILNNRYTEIGVAIVKGTYKGESVWIGVQEFGLPISACAEPNNSLKEKINLNRTELDSIAQTMDQIEKQIDQTNPRSEAYQKMVDDYNALVNNYNNLVATTKADIETYNLQVSNFNNCVAGK